MSKTPQTKAYREAWRRDRARGIKRYVDPAPAREHVRMLMARGMSGGHIAASAGVSKQVVHELLRDDRKFLTRRSAEKILACNGALRRGAAAETMFVPALGVRRRIQALIAIGWTHDAMKAHSGVYTAVTLNQSGDWATIAMHRRVAAMYEALCMTPGPSQISRQRAKKLGYAVPLAWENIDDPNETPDLGDSRPVGVQVEDVEWLLRTGVHGESLAKRLGITLESVETACRRAGRNDLIPALKRGWDEGSVAS